MTELTSKKKKKKSHRGQPPPPILRYKKSMPYLFVIYPPLGREEPAAAEIRKADPNLFHNFQCMTHSYIRSAAVTSDLPIYIHSLPGQLGTHLYYFVSRVWGGGGGAGCKDQHPGQCFVFNPPTGDLRQLGTSPESIIITMPINFSSNLVLGHI